MLPDPEIVKVYSIATNIPYDDIRMNMAATKRKFLITGS